MSDRAGVVLVGAGHGHLYLARRADAFVARGAELVLIDPGRFWYSGLATGMLGGAYPPEADRIDPRPLVERGGGRFLRDRVVGMDPQRRVLQLENGAEQAYDFVSFNVGSEVSVDAIPGAAQRAWTVKPISNLWRLRTHLTARFDEADRPVSVVVIGGGATGCEIAANLTALADACDGIADITLVSAGERVLAQHTDRAARTMMGALEERQVRVIGGQRVERIDASAVLLEDGERLRCDDVIMATGLRPPPMLTALGLPLGNDGGLRVSATLQSIADERVFGVGDCISLEGHDLPRIGVFGVREAPVLHRNLLAMIRGAELAAYRPQKRYLTILNLGFGEALAIRGRLYWRGRLSMVLKDWLDRRFLRQYRTN